MQLKVVKERSNTRHYIDIPEQSLSFLLSLLSSLPLLSLWFYGGEIVEGSGVLGLTLR